MEKLINRIFKFSIDISRLAGPMLWSRVTSVAVSIVGILMIAQLGHNELAASTLAFTLFSTVIMFIYGIIYAISIIIGKAYGAGEHALIGQIVRHGLIYATILSAPCILLFWNIAPLLIFLHQPLNIIPEAQQFMRAISLMIVPAFWYVVFCQYVAGISKPKIITISTMINAPVNIFLFYVFIFGKFGFPAWGVWGMGVAYLLSTILELFVIMAYVLHHPDFAHFNLLKRYKKPGKFYHHALEITKLGLPMGIQYGAEMIAFSISTFVIGTFGSVALVAQQISSQVIIFAVMIPFTVAEAVAILIGQEIGRKNKDHFKEIAYTGCFVGLLAYTIIATIIAIFHRQYIDLYIGKHVFQPQQVYFLATTFLLITLTSQWFDSARNIISGALRGMFDSKAPMWVGMLTMWFIGLPIGLIFAFPLHFEGVGMKIGLAIAIIFASLILFIRFNRKLITFEIPESK